MSISVESPASAYHGQSSLSCPATTPVTNPTFSTPTISSSVENCKVDTQLESGWFFPTLDSVSKVYSDHVDASSVKGDFPDASLSGMVTNGSFEIMHAPGIWTGASAIELTESLQKGLGLTGTTLHLVFSPNIRNVSAALSQGPLNTSTQQKIQIACDSPYQSSSTTLKSPCSPTALFASCEVSFDSLDSSRQIASHTVLLDMKADSVTTSARLHNTLLYLSSPSKGDSAYYFTVIKNPTDGSFQVEFLVTASKGEFSTGSQNIKFSIIDTQSSYTKIELSDYVALEGFSASCSFIPH